MSGGRVTVSGTNYTIKNGRVTVGGTNYSIKKGKTTIGGTNYTIFLKEMTTNALFKNMSIKAIHGSDHANNSSSSPGAILIVPPAAGTYYAFGVSGHGLSIAKCIFTGSTGNWTISITELKHVYNSGSGSTEITINKSSNNTYVFLDSILSDDDIRGTLILAQFTDYTVAEVDSLISASSPAVVAGRYSASKGTGPSVDASNLVGKISIFATGQNMAFNYFSSATSYTTLQSSVSEEYVSASGLVYINSSEAKAYVSYNGTSAASCRTGTIATI